MNKNVVGIWKVKFLFKLMHILEIKNKNKLEQIE